MLALGCYWLYIKWPANRSNYTFKSKLHSYLQGMYCSELGKNTIFLEHPVHCTLCFTLSAKVTMNQAATCQRPHSFIKINVAIVVGGLKEMIYIHTYVLARFELVFFRF